MSTKSIPMRFLSLLLEVNRVSFKWNLLLGGFLIILKLFGFFSIVPLLPILFYLFLSALLALQSNPEDFELLFAQARRKIVEWYDRTDTLRERKFFYLHPLLSKLFLNAISLGLIRIATFLKTASLKELSILFLRSAFIGLSAISIGLLLAKRSSGLAQNMNKYLLVLTAGLGLIVILFEQDQQRTWNLKDKPWFLYFVAALSMLMGTTLYMITSTLGWISMFISAVSVLFFFGFIVLSIKSDSGRQNIIERCARLIRAQRSFSLLLLFLVLFIVIGFTFISYPSASFADEYYGDIHGAYANRIQPFPQILIQGGSSLFLIELLLFEKVLFWASRVEVLIMATIINRLIAFVLFFLIGKAILHSVAKIGPALLSFVFAPWLVAFTQGIKFVVGLPVFLGWILAFLQYQKSHQKKWLLLEIILSILILFSEQWIVFLWVAVYLLYPMGQLFFGYQISLKDALFAGWITVGVIGLYVLEQWRYIADLNPFLSIQPYYHRFPYLVNFLPFFIPALLGLVLLCWLKRKKQIQFRGAALIFVGFLFLPYLHAVRFGLFWSGLDTVYARLGGAYLLALLPVAGFCVWGLARKKFVNQQTIFILTFFAVAMLPSVMLFIGVTFPSSVYLISLALLLTVLLALQLGSNDAHLFKSNIILFIWFMLFLTWVGAFYQFLIYVQGAARWAIVPLLVIVTVFASLYVPSEKVLPAQQPYVDRF